MSVHDSTDTSFDERFRAPHWTGETLAVITDPDVWPAPTASIVHPGRAETQWVRVPKGLLVDLHEVR